MTGSRLPLLRGRVTKVDAYESPKPARMPVPRLPSLDPAAHRSTLLAQLDAMQQQIRERGPNRRDELATREIVAIRPAADLTLVAEQLDNTKADARLIGVVPETGTVLLDVANPDLAYLRKRLDAFADDTQVREKKNRDGTPKLDENGVPVTARASENAVGPIGGIALARMDDTGEARGRIDEVPPDRPLWFEIGCRGGYLNPDEFRRNSRAQIARQLYRVGANSNGTNPILESFDAPERTYFYVQVTFAQLAALQEATDCIFEWDLAPPALRDLQISKEVKTTDLRGFELRPPPEHAPAVVVLDTGIATGHPLLKAAILSATHVTEVQSPEDTHGHGTRMAGLALHRDVGWAIQRGQADATHWLQSARLLVRPGYGTAADANCEKWPILTERAVLSAEAADPRTRNRAFVLAVTTSMQDPPYDGVEPTLWSQAVGQLAFAGGQGRLLVVSAGNARDHQWLALAEQYPHLQTAEKIHQPAQAANALTVGAFTERVELPLERDYAEAWVVARRPGGISPFTSSGPPGAGWPIKPDVVFEGGNLAIVGALPDAQVPTLSALTTSHRHTLGSPLAWTSMTSEASARAARLAAHIWSLEPNLRPATVRGLIVHSASWTDVMLTDLQNPNDRLQVCGYGVPDERLASECAQGVATIVVEDSMPNAVVDLKKRKNPPKRPETPNTERKKGRRVKFYRLPIPDTLLGVDDEDVELRVTLSYFAEPNRYRRRSRHGLDLKWDMQGPQESEASFMQRINALARAPDEQGRRVRVDRTKSFAWQLGIQTRSRGTVQSDRWRGKMSNLAGDKLIAVVPVLGWWDQRKAKEYEELNFSLIVSVMGPGVYAAIAPRVAVEVEQEVEVDV